jgi:hypothetical protein
MSLPPIQPADSPVFPARQSGQSGRTYPSVSSQQSFPSGTSEDETEEQVVQRLLGFALDQFNMGLGTLQHIISNDRDYIQIKDAVRSLEKRKSNIREFILLPQTRGAKPLTPESAFRLGSYSPDSPEVLQTPDEHSGRQKPKKSTKLPPITPRELFKNPRRATVPAQELPPIQPSLAVSGGAMTLHGRHGRGTFFTI